MMNIYVFERNGDWSNSTLFVAANTEQEAKDLAIEKFEIDKDEMGDHEIYLHPKLNMIVKLLKSYLLFMKVNRV